MDVYDIKPYRRISLWISDEGAEIFPFSALQPVATTEAVSYPLWHLKTREQVGKEVGS